LVDKKGRDPGRKKVGEKGPVSPGGRERIQLSNPEKGPNSEKKKEMARGRNGAGIKKTVGRIKSAEADYRGGLRMRSNRQKQKEGKGKEIRSLLF